MKLKTAFTLFMLAISASALAISLEREAELNKEFQSYCEQASRYLVKNRYSVTCENDFHHYNSRAAQNHYRSQRGQSLKIANYNLLHPGSNKNSYKDMALMAVIMNEYDLISVQEIIPRLGNDMRSNNEIAKMIEDGANDKLAEHYKAPGYIQILEELRKLDPSWALITSPRGEASAASSVHELVGFYYRASIVKPTETAHCQEQDTASSDAYACFPNFRKSYFGRDVADAFSRKPFIASFVSGDYDFTIMNAHVIYTSPRDEETMRWISQVAFGVDDYSQVGVGVTKETYARFAEVKLSLEMLDRLIDDYEEQDVIFAADMNLESKVAYWSDIFKTHKRFSLYGEMATSLTPYRYGRNGEETGGFSSNYDHFIVNDRANKNCRRGNDGKIVVERQGYFDGAVDRWMKKNYLVREETGDDKEPYRVSKAGERIMRNQLESHQTWLESQMLMIEGELVKQFDDVSKELDIFKRRIFDEQLSDFTYYKLYRELISDHFPISMSCDI